MKNNIYVVGSINMDLTISTDRFPKKGETIRGYDYIEIPGGKGANQAASIGNLGGKVYMIGCVGRDSYGIKSINDLEKYHVDTQGILKVNENTGLAIIVKSQYDNFIIINEGANSKLTEKHINKHLESARRGDYLVMQFEIPKDIIVKTLKIAKSKNMVTIFNPAPAYEIDDKMYKNIDHIIINQTEAEFFTGIYPENLEDCKNVAKILLEKGVKVVIITLGKEGSVLINKDKILFEKSIPITPVDTTGAGDAFIGAYVSGLSSNTTEEDVLKRANLYAGMVCMENGARENLPSKNNLKRLEDNNEENKINNRY